MNQYPVDQSFGLAKIFQVPFNKTLVSLSRNFMHHPEACLKNRDDIIVESERIIVQNGMIDMHVIIPKEHLKKNPCLFYIHGGGFAFDAQIHQFKNVAEYAIKTGSVIVFPRYRLTPKYADPVLMNDCISAWQWMLSNAEKYHIDRDRIGIGGDSAGGYLAARLTNLLVLKKMSVKYQLLVYPVIDCMMRTESMHKFTDTPMWNAECNKTMWKWYARGTKQQYGLLDEVLPCAIPTTYIETAEYDCLHDEGLAYAKRLKETGINVTVNETHGTMHGFDCISCEITQNAILSRIQFIHQQITKQEM